MDRLTLVRSALDTEAVPSTSQLVVAAWYALAAAAYIVIGVCFTDFLFSFFVAVGYLFVVAWCVPAAVRRFL